MAILQRELDAEYNHALLWMRTVYFSELAFLFHLPLFIGLETASGAHPLFQRVLYGFRAICNILAVTLYFRFGLWLSASIFLGLSVVLYYISFEHQKLHLANQLFAVAKSQTTEEGRYPSLFPATLYWITHTFSPLNFTLDLPALGIPTVKATRAIICTVNIVALLYYLFYLWCDEPLDDAWGCYASYDGIDDLQYGMCPAAYGRAVASCCDQPGVDCTKSSQSDTNNMHALSPFLFHALGLTFSIYSISARTKITYMLATEQKTCALIARAIKQS
jgi:hypothetical protein